MLDAKQTRPSPVLERVWLHETGEGMSREEALGLSPGRWKQQKF